MKLKIEKAKNVVHITLFYDTESAPLEITLKPEQIDGLLNILTAAKNANKLFELEL